MSTGLWRHICPGWRANTLKETRFTPCFHYHSEWFSETWGFTKTAKTNQKKKIFADILTLSASGQPPSSQFLKSLLCLVLNNYHSVALAHILMRSFKKLILHHIKDNIPASLDPHQYAFRTNRFTKNAVSTTLHNLPEEADWKTQHSGLEYLTLDSGLPHKQTPGSLDWHLHFL